ncbi:hypothetical protein JCM3765_005527 [Sporobolomyces pararoseus]
MEEDTGIRKALSASLKALEAPSILDGLVFYERKRQITQGLVAELLLAEEQDWCRMQPWHKEFLEKVRDTSEQATTLFWQIDLAWRRYIFRTAILDHSLAREQYYSTVDTYFKPPIEPYTDEDYPLGLQLDHIVKFGNIYKSILENWEESCDPRELLDNFESPMDTDIIVEMTKKFVKGYMSHDFSAEIVPDDSDPSQGPGAHEAGPSSSSRSPAAARNGSSFTMAPSNGNVTEESEKKKGKRRRDDGDDSGGDNRGDYSGDDGMDIDQAEEAEQQPSNESSQHQPILRSSPSQPVSPTYPALKEDDKSMLAHHLSPPVAGPSNPRSSGISTPNESVRAVEDLAIALESSQFPHPLTKPTFLTRVSQSPAPSIKERSGSPFGGTPRRGLPPGIRSMAVQTQTKLAKARRSSEMHLLQERIKSESVERSLSVEASQLQQMGIDRDERMAEEKSAEVEAAKREREKTQEVEPKEEEQQRRQLGAVPSGVLMPPPTTISRSSAPNSSGESAPLPSSAEEPSTLVEPSTILSSPPRPKSKSKSIDPPQIEEVLAAPSGSSLEEDRPTQELGFPTAAQPGPPHESLADLLPTASSDTTFERNLYQSEESQGESQSQPEGFANPAQNKGQTLPTTTITNSQSSPSSSSQHYPRLLVPDTSASTNADSSSLGSLSGAQESNPTSLLEPSRARTRSRSKSREPSVPAASPARVLRRSSRLSKSPAPAELTRWSPSKQATADLNPGLSLVSSNESSESQSQAFFTQAPIVDSQESAHPVSQLVEVAEEEEEERSNSQDSSGLTYASYEAATKTTTTTGKGRHTRFLDSDDDEQAPSREALTDIPAIVDEDFESFGSQDTSGGRSRKMSFGDLENRATGGPPAEEPLDLEDHDV